MIQETKSERIVCYNHPDRETTLRCNRCERPICADCAVLTPTGYRCKECVRGQQKIFDTARWIDYPVAFIIAAALSSIGLLLLRMVGFWFIVLFIAPVVGVIIAEAVRRAVGRRRSRRRPLAHRSGEALGRGGARPGGADRVLVGGLGGGRGGALQHFGDLLAKVFLRRFLRGRGFYRGRRLCLAFFSFPPGRLFLQLVELFTQLENLKALLAAGAVGKLFYVEVDYWHGLGPTWTGWEWGGSERLSADRQPGGSPPEGEHDG